MDKESKEMLKELNEVLGDLLNDNITGVNSKIKDKIQEAFKEEATISIKKSKDGRAETHVEGSTLAILITLAGLEKTVLEKLNTPNAIWEMIKHTVGTEEANNND